MAVKGVHCLKYAKDHSSPLRKVYHSTFTIVSCVSSKDVMPKSAKDIRCSFSKKFKPIMVSSTSPFSSSVKPGVMAV
eukprot:6332992-Amphidinium_carterae.1